MKKILIFVFAAMFFAGCEKFNNIFSPSAPQTPPTAGVTEAEDMGEIVSASAGKLNPIYFDFDKSTISDSMQQAIVYNADYLKNTKGTVVIEGNGDEWGNDEYNFVLGIKRAKVVKTALVDAGIPASRFKVLSNGDGNKLCADTKTCGIQNRRVDIKVLP